MGTVFHRAKSIVLPFALLGLVMLIGAAVWLRLHGTLYLSVQSGSMEPVLHKGDLVLVSRIPATDLQVGDIVTFISPQDDKTPITHRIVATPSTETGYRFVTKGDANPSADSSILPSSIVGRQTYTVPKLGYVADVMRRPIGLALLIYLPALWIIGAEIRRLQDHYRQRQPYISPDMIKRLEVSPRVPITMALGLVLAAGIGALSVYRQAEAWQFRRSTLEASSIMTIRVTLPPTRAIPLPEVPVPDAGTAATTTQPPAPQTTHKPSAPSETPERAIQPNPAQATQNNTDTIAPPPTNQSAPSATGQPSAPTGRSRGLR